jgi:hypothetical protein
MNSPLHEVKGDVRLIAWFCRHMEPRRGRVGASSRRKPRNQRRATGDELSELDFCSED